MKRINFAILITLLCCTALSAYDLGNHPRIFINQENLPRIAERAYAEGMLADDYAMIKKEADRLVDVRALRYPDRPSTRPTDMICAAIAYLVEREHGNEEADSYAQVILEIWGDGTVLSRNGSEHFGTQAIVYDWIYDAMSDDQRILYGDKLGEWLYWYTNQPKITLQSGDWLYNQTWGPVHLSTPNCRDGIAPKLMVALAIADEGSIYDDAAFEFLDSWESRIPSECIPRFDLIGGVWSESMGHGNYGPVNVIPWAFEAWRTATGEDFFQLGEQNSYLKGLNQWAMYLTVPFNNRTAPIDDNNGFDVVSKTMYMSSPILGARYKDPAANSLSSDYYRGTKWYNAPWVRFITYDTDIIPETPGELDWPTARLFTGAGHLYLRSHWDDPNATWVFFGAGPWYANHSRDDEGHFMIAKKGWLVQRVAGQGHNDDGYYWGGSLAFNIVTVFDPDESFRRTSPGASRLENGGTKNERDGGMKRLVYSGDHTAVKQRGHIEAYKHTARYTYAAADLTDAYRAEKINEITRQFLYINGPREYVVIFDRVDATNAEFPKTWFLHIPTEPTLDGNETVLTQDHVYSYSGGTTTTWLSDAVGQGGVKSDGHSRGFLKTLLPKSAVITKRGGKGYDLWGHPHEPTAQYNHTGKSSNQAPKVLWRLEVEAPQGEERDYFLHVLEIGNEFDTKMSDVSLLENVDKAGVSLESGLGYSIEVYFSRQGGMSATIKYGEENVEQLSEVIDTNVDEQLEGDINGDGILNVSDAIALMMTIRNDPGNLRVDFNRDESTDVRDVISLLLFMRG